ncbi:hypothetical protein ACIRU2_13675 [Streptomyces sp. NPDC101169]|uniref:hypothetical protein n=1 Tax=Streptomyces sp. NPDC101169 TaxID=3366121 RepID=UPI003819C9C7
MPLVAQHVYTPPESARGAACPPASTPLPPPPVDRPRRCLWRSGARLGPSYGNHVHEGLLDWKADEPCAREMPEFSAASRPGHRYRCHHPVEEDQPIRDPARQEP